MARRHSQSSDFQAVGLSQDPTPGDIDEIRKIEVIYRDVADGAAGALTLLQRGGSIALGRGSAMDGLRDHIDDDLPGKLTKARDSYQEAADAYSAYIPKLQEAQDLFDRAVDDALTAQTQIDGSIPALGADPTEAEVADNQAAQDRQDAGRQQLSAAKGLAAQARAVRDAAANRCSDSLDSAAGKAIRIPKRSFFQRVADFFKKFPFVQILLAVLIAVVAVFVPVVGAILAGLLFTFQQATAIATGAFQVGDFLVGLVGLIPGGALLRTTGAAVKAAEGSIFSGGLRNLESFLNNINSLQESLSTFQSVTVGAVFDFGSQGLNSALNGEKFDALGALEGAALGAAVGGAAGGIAKKGIPVPDNPARNLPPGPPGQSDFSAFDPTLGERARDAVAATSADVAKQGLDILQNQAEAPGIPVKGTPPEPA